ncbi:MAG TPA: cytochrome c oxidase subunit 3 [Brumimicrobium sp.]|nr:cytochrome c oxidase subunit 3 [Brumimicrobium sp.]
MKRNFSDELPIETQEKTRKNLVWTLILSISMMFAGLTSAYIVSMGNSFWVKINLPTAFFVSTAIIIVSSFIFHFALKSEKAGNRARTKILLIIVLISGVGFGVSQFMGYSALVKSGAHFVSNVIVADGRYGDYYEIKKDGEYLTVENNQYYFKGEKLDGAEKKAFHDFANQFLVPELKDLKGKNISFDGFTLLYKSEPLTFVNGEFIRPNGEKLVALDFERLHDLARNIVDDRADFFVRGEMGKDFKLLYNKNELDYQERTLMFKGQPLSPNLQNKLLRGNNDTSTAYFYIITLVHLLHVLGGIIMLIVLVSNSYTVKSSQKLMVSLKAGAIFWHFLGILWIYLLLFLLFIH